MLHNRLRFESWLPALFDGEFDWDFLLPAFKETKIRPMDFDAVIERKGKILIFETKIPGKNIELGQALTLTDQWRKGATIFVLSGKTPQTIDGMATYASSQFTESLKIGDFPLKPSDFTEVLFQTRRWFCWANGWDQPSREIWERELWWWDYDRQEKS